MSKNLYQAAVLVDAGFLLKKLYRHDEKRPPTTQEVVGFVMHSLCDEETLFRIYVYDCPPLETVAANPDRSIHT